MRFIIIAAAACVTALPGSSFSATQSAPVPRLVFAQLAAADVRKGADAAASAVKAGTLVSAGVTVDPAPEKAVGYQLGASKVWIVPDRALAAGTVVDAAVVPLALVITSGGTLGDY